MGDHISNEKKQQQRPLKKCRTCTSTRAREHRQDREVVQDQVPTVLVVNTALQLLQPLRDQRQCLGLGLRGAHLCAVDVPLHLHTE